MIADFQGNLRLPRDRYGTIPTLNHQLRYAVYEKWEIDHSKKRKVEAWFSNYGFRKSRKNPPYSIKRT